ncbi:MAG: energy-coupling factor transporter ATPase [Ruminococcus sp.]|nr:energy-coupling factor transporter ATPase [Ruminococcus sp.]MDE7226156.1 energy-coupling factor transporter ATPase [Ruminococcus sp.]
MAVLETQELTYVYSQGSPFEKTAVDSVSLKIDEGAIIGVMGHTGSGKSTLIQQFNGLLRPTSGKILLDGVDIWADRKKIRDVRFRVGLVFQYPEYQIFEETVYKDIAFGPKNMGLDSVEIKRRVLETAHDIGIPEELLERSPFELSGGQKRRVAIAGVMAMNPEILILDEPTAGLDPAGRDKIIGFIKEYHRKKGNTVLIVSHSMEDIAGFADKILVMNKSRLFCYDDTEKVFSRAEEISRIGLDIPQITKIFIELKKNGIDFGKDVYTLDYAEKLLIKKLGERSRENC